ncbi:MAG TPA: hypothetical protein VI299_02220 [Polyangiales bacterium]
MAVTFGLDFAIVYACVLALFSYLTFWFIPIVARAAFVAVKRWLAQPPRPRKEPPPDGEPWPGLWFEPRHSR